MSTIGENLVFKKLETSPFNFTEIRLQKLVDDKSS